MPNPDPHGFSKKDVEATLAPIELRAASGNWIPARHAIEVVKEICGIDSAESVRTICRRAVLSVPISCLTWSVGEDPHDFIDRYDYFAKNKRLNQHFGRTLDRQSFDEITPFFEALEYGASREGKWEIKLASWATGDFTVHLERDFSVVKLSVLGLQFDQTALERSFASTAQNDEVSRRSGRRPKYNWPAASLAVFGKIHRGDFKPANQADIERALIAHLGDQHGGPSESTVRPYAKLIWEESQKA